MEGIIILLLLPFTLQQEIEFRINEKLSTDNHFFQLWNDLVSLQSRQLDEHSDDLLSVSSLSSLSSCTRIPSRPDHVDALRPSDISIYADLGHLSTFCRHDMTHLLKGDLDSCGHHSSSSSLPTLDKFIRVFNPNLTVVDVHRKKGETLTSQVQRIAQEMRQIPGFEDKWKLIAILPNIQDGEASETGQAAVEVLSAVENLTESLPRKTLIVVVRNSGKGIWRDASHAHSACQIMLDRWKKYVDFNMNTVWEQVDMIVQKNFRSAEFSVEILPLLNEASLAQLPNSTDLSALGYDCAHWSERGLSLVHESIWNELLTSASLRTKEFRPIHNQLICPDPRCPFIRTASNSAMCLWSPIEDSSSLAPQLIAVSILLVCLLLCLCLIAFLCLRKGRDTLTKEKAFGSNFSSIRFIDDDIA